MFPVVFFFLTCQLFPLSPSFPLCLCLSWTKQIDCNSCQTENSTEFERHRRRCCLLHCCTADAVDDAATNYFYRFGCRHQKTQAAFHNQMLPQQLPLLLHRDASRRVATSAATSTGCNCCCCCCGCEWHHQRSLAGHVAGTNVLHWERRKYGYSQQGIWQIICKIYWKSYTISAETL